MWKIKWYIFVFGFNLILKVFIKCLLCLEYCVCCFRKYKDLILDYYFMEYIDLNILNYDINQIGVRILIMGVKKVS